ncbi:hypothetical protein QAD02_023456 [Eretmocerus hayati]|uniref:Uncharacterized protein n=1 Tax=Eretmocerus hayati TaxID=131215 RepID=A0ACC2PW89_9HYME|nr:hypothetical protein QAD02_023456 [Eretmocerus hayati]
MNLTVLSGIDYLARALVIDPVIGFPTKKVAQKSHVPKETLKEIQQVGYSYSRVTSREVLMKFLLNESLTRRFLHKFSIPSKTSFSNILSSYIDLRLSNSMKVIERPAYDASPQLECGVFAQRPLKKNEKMQEMKGFHVSVTSNEFLWLKENNSHFSVMKSSKTGENLLMLGPLSFINHDCNPNCVYNSEPQDHISLRMIRDVTEGEELLCYYGDGYFGRDNADCKCSTCMNKPKSDEALEHIEEIEPAPPESVSFSRDVGSTVDICSFIDEVFHSTPLRDIPDIARRLIQNVIEFKQRSTSMNMKESSEERRAFTRNGLKSSQEMYRNFIRFVVDRNVELSELCKNEEVLKMLMTTVYKNDVRSSRNCLVTFVSDYEGTIRQDIKDYVEGKAIMAPEAKKMHSFFQKLCLSGILMSPKKFAESLYGGNKISGADKKLFVQMMREPGIEPKVENALAKYSVTLRKTSEEIVNRVMAIIKINASAVSVTLARCSPREDIPHPTELCNSFMDESRISSMQLTSEEIANIIGVDM